MSRGRTMARVQRQPTEHTAWCSRDHRCGIDLHQGADIIADHLGARAVITRVRAADTDYAEVRMRIPLHPNDFTARRQLAAVLDLARHLLRTVAAIRPAPLGGNTRPALDRRPHR